MGLRPPYGATRNRAKQKYIPVNGQKQGTLDRSTGRAERKKRRTPDGTGGPVMADVGLDLMVSGLAEWLASEWSAQVWQPVPRRRPSPDRLDRKA